MCSDPADLTIELELDDFEDLASEEPSFSRLELAFFAEGDELDREPTSERH